METRLLKVLTALFDLGIKRGEVLNYAHFACYFE